MPKILFISICLFLISGCAQQRIVEELGFIHTVSYDLNEADNAEEEGVLIMTVAFPQVAPTAEKRIVRLTTTAHTSKEGRAKLARQTENVLVSGQLRSVLFSEDFARKGFLDTIDTLKRDHQIGLNVNIIVVTGQGKDLLMGDYPEHPRIGRYIYELIEKEAQTHVTVQTSLYKFIRDYYDDGIDPVTPILKQGKEEIIIDGIGLFCGDQLVHRVTPRDARVFMMLHGDYLGGSITKKLKLKEERKDDDYLYITFNTLESQRKVNVKSPSQVEIMIDVKGAIEEYTGYLNLAEDKFQKEIEADLAAYIEKTAEKIISEMQEKKTDSLGIGQYVRNGLSYEKWKSMKWKEEIYPDAEIAVRANVKLKGFGSVK